METKTKLINRLTKVVEDLQGIQTEFSSILKDFSSPDKSKIISASTIQKKLEVKGYEFSIISNILIEDFNTDFNTEVPDNVKNLYFESLKLLEELKNKGTDIPEELKKLLETKK